MERLTYDFCLGGEHCWQVQGADNLTCEEVCRRQADSGCKNCPIKMAFERLAAYEDTGLEPGEIVAVLKGVVPGAGIFTLVQDDPQFYPETNGWYVSADTVGAIGIGGFYAGEPTENTFFKYEEIGRGVFLSKEKAEYALEERKNETTDNQ